ncbi:PQQ-dependent sugar dehydrogenase [Pseudanabaena sp. FACHB-2040]|uniref:PQQ-dependent sugar dehydrogenase n=1 Tax=Pseudanabaena sp. FACHB-2040 TaxID=2692859 RepID=UPI001F54A889|nr:PQQ-dependent sugar dehydrogenase [Pseudanabaena sp. FACHB-2040]
MNQISTQNSRLKRHTALLLRGMVASAIALAACQPTTPTPTQPEQTPEPQTTAPEQVQQVSTTNATCELVEQGFGPTGQVDIRVEEVASGLEVPWGIDFLPNSDMLVTERAGRVRLVRQGQLQPNPVATIEATDVGEGGLLGIAVHPDFASNRWFYVYYTANRDGSRTNLVERWQLSEDGLSATRDRTILGDIPVAQFHNGGRIRFGPDGMLYIGTGDARDPDISQDQNSLAGKILRVTPEGEVPADNPFPGNPVFISGIRNTQGFDWIDASTLWVTDHGPSGELGRSGHDKASVARAGDNLGWPTTYRCESEPGLVTPSIVWQQALPPGGSVIYTGTAIPEWQDSLIIATLRSEHLQRVAFDPQNPGQVQSHEVYLQGEYGRLRDAVMGPDGELYITTSNCDGRGGCPSEQDKILRVTR